MDLGSVFISGAALIVSAFSFYFSIKSWRESNRPLITARVSTHSGGNVGCALDLIVENTGNRPARNIRLIVNLEKLNAALLLNAHEQLKKNRLKIAFPIEASYLCWQMADQSLTALDS